MQFTFVQDDNNVRVYAEAASRKQGNTHVATIVDWSASNPLINWHIPYGLAGTLTLLNKFKTWKAERE